MIENMIEKSFEAFDDLVEDAENAEEEGDEEYLEEIESEFLTQIENVEEVAPSSAPEDEVRERLEQGDKLSEVIADYKENRLESLVENLPI